MHWHLSMQFILTYMEKLQYICNYFLCCYGTVTALHRTVPGSVPSRVDLLQPSILGNLGSSNHGLESQQQLGNKLWSHIPPKLAGWSLTSLWTNESENSSWLVGPGPQWTVEFSNYCNYFRKLLGKDFPKIISRICPLWWWNSIIS